MPAPTIILVHCRAQSSTIHLHRVLSQIRDHGKLAGAVLNPATPPEVLDYVLPLCDVILLMSVNPGFGGQKFIADIIPKIRKLRQACNERGLSPRIEIDGGINAETAPLVIAAGADALVAGCGRGSSSPRLCQGDQPRCAPRAADLIANGPDPNATACPMPSATGALRRKRPRIRGLPVERVDSHDWPRQPGRLALSLSGGSDARSRLYRAAGRPALPRPRCPGTGSIGFGAMSASCRQDDADNPITAWRKRGHARQGADPGRPISTPAPVSGMEPEQACCPRL